MEIIASQKSETTILTVNSSSSLDVPNKITTDGQGFRIVHFGDQPQPWSETEIIYGVSPVLLGYTPYSPTLNDLTLTFSRIKSESGLYKAHIDSNLFIGKHSLLPSLDWLVEKIKKFEHPETRLTDIGSLDGKRESTDGFAKHQEFDTDAVEAFEEFLLEDCKERAQKGKLPFQTRKHWLKHIQGLDSFDKFFGRRVENSKVPNFADHLTSEFYYTQSTTLPPRNIMKFKYTPESRLSVGYYSSEWDSPETSHVVCAVFNKARDLVTREMTSAEMDTFKFDFAKLNGFDFDDVIEWMRGAPMLEHRGDGFNMDQEELSTTNTLVNQFNKTNSDLEYHIGNQEISSIRDQSAIKLFILAYHRKLYRIRYLPHDQWGRFLIDSDSKIWA